VTLSHREDGPADGPVALLVHGYPESSYMWRHLMPALAEVGWRAVAPDLAAFGDSPPDPPGTWERHVESIGHFHDELALGEVVLVVHDWGGLIGLRWACDNPGAVTAIVASNTGLFPEGKWHGFAEAMRSDKGEELMAQMNREALAATLRASSDGFDDDAIDEYWKAFETEDRRMGILDMYRSGDFSKLEPYRGKLAALEVPFLALWGENDPFAPIAGAYRFQKEIPGARVVAVKGARHFVFADDLARCAREIVAFLQEPAA
jgi:haloalkane dehalogenase